MSVGTVVGAPFKQLFNNPFLAHRREEKKS